MKEEISITYGCIDLEEHMVCFMPNRTDLGLHVFDLLEILRIDRLTQVMKKPKI